MLNTIESIWNIVKNQRKREVSVHYSNVHEGDPSGVLNQSELLLESRKCSAVTATTDILDYLCEHFVGRSRTFLLSALGDDDMGK